MDTLTIQRAPIYLRKMSDVYYIPVFRVYHHIFPISVKDLPRLYAVNIILIHLNQKDEMLIMDYILM